MSIQNIITTFALVINKMEKSMKDKSNITDFDEKAFVHDIKTIISKAKFITGRAANLMQVASSWLTGWRIVEQEQKGESKAQYGKHIIELASSALTSEFGKGYSQTSLRDCRKFLPDI